MVAETSRGRDGVARTALGACRHQVVASAVLSEFPSQESPDRIVDVAFLFFFFFSIKLLIC